MPTICPSQDFSPTTIASGWEAFRTAAVKLHAPGAGIHAPVTNSGTIRPKDENDASAH